MEERLNGRRIALIGFGEAGQAFAAGLAGRGHRFTAFDRKTADAVTADAKRADYAAAGIGGADDPAGALADAELVFSLVTADQAEAAAAAAAPHLPDGAFWFEMNSIAPDTKRAIAAALPRARFVDTAVMAPVNPKRQAVPLLTSGPHGAAGATLLADLGFENVRAVEGPLGAASSIKMIRSVMVKGIEALTAECLLAAHKAGVADQVIASLSASTGQDWAAQGDYNLDRMMVHGSRRAAEMEEVVKTLDALGTGSVMTRGTVERQRAIGALGLSPPPESHAAKTAAILDATEAEPA
ncbi:MAG: DUF1932 domain-containing protein [Sphingomonas fennica]